MQERWRANPELEAEEATVSEARTFCLEELGALVDGVKVGTGHMSL